MQQPQQLQRLMDMRISHPMQEAAAEVMLLLLQVNITGEQQVSKGRPEFQEPTLHMLLLLPSMQVSACLSHAAS